MPWPRSHDKIVGKLELNPLSSLSFHCTGTHSSHYAFFFSKLLNKHKQKLLSS